MTVVPQIGRGVETPSPFLKAYTILGTSLLYRSVFSIQSLKCIFQESHESCSETGGAASFSTRKRFQSPIQTSTTILYARINTILEGSKGGCLWRILYLSLRISRKRIISSLSHGSGWGRRHWGSATSRGTTCPAR